MSYLIPLLFADVPVYFCVVIAQQNDTNKRHGQDDIPL